MLPGPDVRAERRVTTEDDALAGVAALTGPDAARVVHRAAERLGARLLAHRLHRIHHRPGRSIARVDHVRLQRGGTASDTLLVTHLSSRAFPAAATTLPIDATHAAVWTFRDDPYLPALSTVTEPRRLRAVVDQPMRAAVEVRRRAYRPTRRAVLEVERSGTTASELFLKVLRPERAQRIVRVHRRLAERLPVPVPIRCAEPGVVALLPLPGRSLRRCLLEGARVPDPAALVELSLALQATVLPPELQARPRAFADPTPHVRGLVQALPHLAARVRAVVAEVVSAPAAADVTVHGDLHGGQVFVDGGEVSGLLDLDGVGAGSLAHDAGNLLAHLGALAERGPAGGAAITAYTDRVTAAYGEVVDPATLRYATAGAWLALAASAHCRRDPELVAARVGRAEALLA
jgi:hypothetical protein